MDGDPCEPDDCISTSSYFEPCDDGQCPSPYVCTSTEPRHPDHPVGDFCFLPCESQADCDREPAFSVCVCKGVTGEADGAVPDGYCDCG